jgi:Ran GTPase-activating protein (RanGAP) involved in mRNA processing and transport
MNISDKGCKAVANFLSENSHFVVIDLKSNKISSSGLNKLCSSFRQMKNLKILSLNSNYLGQDTLGLESLYTLLQGKCNIRQLNLRNNNLLEDHC